MDTCLSFHLAYYADSICYAIVKQSQQQIFYYLVSDNTELHADAVCNVNSQDNPI